MTFYNTVVLWNDRCEEWNSDDTTGFWEFNEEVGLGGPGKIESKGKEWGEGCFQCF